MNAKDGWEIKNFCIYATLRDKPLHILQNRIAYIPFRGTLPEAKIKAQALLHEQEGAGWKVVVESDGETIYCTYDYPIEQSQSQ